MTINLTQQEIADAVAQYVFRKGCIGEEDKRNIGVSFWVSASEDKHSCITAKITIEKQE